VEARKHFMKKLLLTLPPGFRMPLEYAASRPRR
jgi:hypothetical protein